MKQENNMHTEDTYRALHFIEATETGINWLGFEPTGNWPLDNKIGAHMVDCLMTQAKKDGDPNPVVQTLLAMSELGRADYRGVIVGFGIRLGEFLSK